jgi:uncharacterized protein (TIGR03437 family)
MHRLSGRIDLLYVLFAVCLALAGSVSCFAQATAAVTAINYVGLTGTFPVAPGSIASACGNFGNVPTTALETFNPMPKELAGVRLRVNEVDAPLYFVSPTQINFVVPWSIPAGRHDLEVVMGGSVIARGTVNVYDIAPGLASSDTSPLRQGIIQNQDFAINGPAAPARKGEAIQIYATGCGAVEPAVADGMPPAGLSGAVATVKVFISVEEAQVQFAGAHPLFPGICQVNAFVPDRSFITGQTPVFITVNGIASNPVSVWVQ